MRGVTRHLNGMFECEVSEDAPFFHTAMKAAAMRVIDLPKQHPDLQIDKKLLNVGENLTAICTVGASLPPSNITWYMNGRRVSGRAIRLIIYPH